MGAVFTKVSQEDVAGLVEELVCQLSFDTLYATGGYTLDAAMIPFRVKSRVDSIQVEAHPTYAFDYDRTDDKSGQLVIYEAAGGGLSEVTPGTDLSALSLRCSLRGR